MLKSLWSFRGFIFSSIQNELISRFARSRIGALWMLLHPILQVAIYATVLSAVLTAKLPGIDNQYAYAIYLTAGILAWTLFAEVVGRCTTLFIDNSNLLKKVSFPKLTLPVVVAGSGLLNNLMLFSAIIVVFAILGHMPGLELVWLVPLTLITLLFSLALGLILGIFNVFLRDIGQIVPVFIQLLFWLTPIVYPAKAVPDYLLRWLELNPMFSVVSAYQAVLVYGQQPELQTLLPIIMLTLLLLAFGLYMFRKAAPEMVDEL